MTLLNLLLDSIKNHTIYKAALNKLITMSYSWYNVRQSYNNNKLRWKKKTDAEWKYIIFSDGLYNYQDINNFIQAHAGKEGDHQIFRFYFHTTIFRVVVLIHKDNEMDLSQGDFADLLGFDKKELKDENNFRRACSRQHPKRWLGLHSLWFDFKKSG